MADPLNTSLTGMLAFQRALAVTSHNIANASTPGYSRQVSQFTARIGASTGNVQAGAGTQVAVVRRMYDALLGDQLQAATTSQSRFATLDTLATRVDTLLADADTGLTSSLQSFFNAVQDVANEPGSIPARQSLLGAANGLAERFQTLDQQLAELGDEVNGRLQLSVTEVNQLAAAIADVNGKIVVANAGSQPPNDLLDERDRLILELSTQIGVTTVSQDDGSINVFIGSGQPLVVGNTAQTLSVRADEFDPTRPSVVLDTGLGGVPLDRELTGGNLGGLLEFRSNMLDPAVQALGETAVAFAQSFNDQHASGMDLRGNLGGAFFAIDPPTVLSSSNNAGSGSAVATVTDLGALTGADYVLGYDGAAYSLTRRDTGAVIPLSGSGSAADPFVADGISIEVAGAPAAGDQLLIRTGYAAASSVRTLISDPQAVAIAAPTRAQASLANTGDASISSATATDPSDPMLLATATIEFLDATTYSIDGAGAFAYTDGSPITINGSTVTISGTPAAGDQFTIQANLGASGDNANGLLLGEVQSNGVLDGGTISINENYGQLVSSVGATTNQIQNSLAAQDVLHANAENAVLSTSGVNLDEEATNMIRYQQAYQAMAQVVAVANTLFDSLLSATRR